MVRRFDIKYRDLTTRLGNLVKNAIVTFGPVIFRNIFVALHK